MFWIWFPRFVTKGFIAVLMKRSTYFIFIIIFLLLSMSILGLELLEIRPDDLFICMIFPFDNFRLHGTPLGVLLGFGLGTPSRKLRRGPMHLLRRRITGYCAKPGVVIECSTHLIAAQLVAIAMENAALK